MDDQAKTRLAALVEQGDLSALLKAILGDADLRVAAEDVEAVVRKYADGKYPAAWRVAGSWVAIGEPGEDERPTLVVFPSTKAQAAPAPVPPPSGSSSDPAP